MRVRTVAEILPAGRDRQGTITVFRAVVFAGLPISDWAEHTQRLPVRERDGGRAGFHASILQ